MLTRFHYLGYIVRASKNFRVPFAIIIRCWVLLDGNVVIKVSLHFIYGNSELIKLTSKINLVTITYKRGNK